jgi:hypothetical protein
MGISEREYMRDTPEWKEYDRTHIHEAGHAVIAGILGFKVVQIEASPSGGQCHTEYPQTTNQSSIALLYAGGFAAEIVFFGYSEYNSIPDITAIKEAGYEVKETVEKAVQLIKSERQWVENIAIELNKTRYIHHGDAHYLLNANIHALKPGIYKKSKVDWYFSPDGEATKKVYEPFVHKPDRPTAADIRETPIYSQTELQSSLIYDTFYECRTAISIIGGIILGLIFLLIIPFWILASTVSLGFCGYAIYQNLQSYKKYGSESINTGIWGILVALSLALPICLITYKIL